MDDGSDSSRSHLLVREDLHKGVSTEEELVGDAEGPGPERLGPFPRPLCPVDESDAAAKDFPGCSRGGRV